MDDQNSGGPSRSARSRSAKSRQSRQEDKSGSPRHESRSRPWWLGPLAVLVLFLVGLGIWLVPSRINDVVSVDGRHRWSDEDLEKLHGAVDEVIAEQAAADPDFKRAYESFSTFRKDYATWKDLGYLK